ncbi:hypothetical protein [Aureivirga sp. CE67]|uniref:hypothetical protein n=1 Tax=Aureivirga sp. CE67 TaxID=1788983 RepID=UPI0018CB4399|nr:hypothetical protein [Aureivirga sp. CE67]
MKKIILLILLIGQNTILQAQIVKNSEGNNTILFNNTNIGIDIDKSEISFNSNNFLNSKLSSSGLIWGVDFTTKNKEGIGSIIKSSDLTPSSNLNITFGFQISNVKKMGDKINKQRTELSNEYKQINENFESKYRTIILEEIKKDKKIVLEQKESPIILDEIKNKIDSNTNICTGLFDLLSKKIKKSTDPIELKYSIKYRDLIKKTDYYKKLKQFSKKNEILNSSVKNILSNKAYMKHVFYTHGGLSNEKFNTFSSWNINDLGKSFNEVKFNGSTLGLGYNLRVGGNWIFGAKYSYQKTNNSSLLALNEYEYESVISSNNTTFTTKGKKSAYSGDYGIIYLNKIEIDALNYISINKSFLIIIDTYLRVKESNNDYLYASHTDLGLASSFFKTGGKFLGGIYLELPDIDQNIERQKVEPKYENWYNRLSFGLYAKFSFDSLSKLNF